MSHSWCDQVVLWLAPSSVALVRASMLPGKHIRTKKLKTLNIANSGPRWLGAVTALDELCSSEMLRRRERVTVILSNHFVRYTVIPWSPEIRTREDEFTLASHYFAQAYGANMTSNWVLGVSGHVAPRPRLASAVDRDLLESVRVAIALKGAQLVSIQPYLMTAFNLWRRKFTDSNSWFVLAERGGANTLVFGNGTYQAIYWENVPAENAPGIRRLVERRWRLAGQEERPRVYLHVPHDLGSASIFGPEWRVTHLIIPSQTDFSPSAEPDYAMAMAAIVQ